MIEGLSRQFVAQGIDKMQDLPSVVSRTREVAIVCFVTFVTIVTVSAFVFCAVWMKDRHKLYTVLPDFIVGNMRGPSEFEDGITEWLGDHPSTDQVKVAKAIRVAYLTNRTYLSLQPRSDIHLYYCDKLNTLPRCIGLLKNLEKLEIKSYSLDSLPEEISQLENLLTLRLISNWLPSFPEPILACKNLRELTIANNPIESIPEGVGELSNLEILTLFRCGLTTLPDSLGKLRNLEYLGVVDNDNLKVLPSTLRQIDALKSIDYSATGIDQQHIDAILTPLGNGSQFQKFRHRELLAFLNSLPPSQQSILEEFYRRLFFIRDMQLYPSDIAETVYSMLKTVQEDEEFRTLFFDHVNPNNAQCHDRPAILLNALYILWRIHTLPQDISLDQKLCFFERAAKTFALREEIDRRIQEKGGSNEADEIHLYFQIQLREKLMLLTPIQSMYHEPIGNVPWIDSDELIKEVENGFPDQYVDIAPLVAMVEGDKEFDLNGQLEPFFDEMLSLYENSQSMRDEKYKLAVQKIKWGMLKKKKELVAKWVDDKRGMLSQEEIEI